MSKLSKREQQVLAQMRLGLKNAEIAEALGIAEGTVKVHVSNVLKKTGTTTRTGAALWNADV